MTLPMLDGDQSPPKSADKSAHSKCFAARPTENRSQPFHYALLPNHTRIAFGWIAGTTSVHIAGR